MDRRRQAADDLRHRRRVGRHRNLLAKSKRFLPPTEPPPSANDYDVSPDGKELCFVSDSAKDYGTRLQQRPLYPEPRSSERQTPKNITQDNEASDSNPVYSPDGTAPRVPAADDQVLLRRPPAAHGARPEIGATERACGRVRRSCQNPKWPDARRLAFEAENGGTHGIYFVNLEDKMFCDRPAEDSPSDRSISPAAGGWASISRAASIGRAAVFATVLA